MMGFAKNAKYKGLTLQSMRTLFISVHFAKHVNLSQVQISNLARGMGTSVHMLMDTYNRSKALSARAAGEQAAEQVKAFAEELMAE
ncbi:hypothetical protein GPECTOR_7g1246 [Gonium pectorale]|uniref:Uncharacterized protein n=1 Tax=Gonium pectorale TaxID=33097 RepID=A0A150GU56_GONPE|nr:hypothetical protein GPECTOR_7g1246 [Gonium pectorale]|eukprot:KXZ53351.1 hypothetical protein GPECTOR_7g1246 [Gonium pectorale]